MHDLDALREMLRAAWAIPHGNGDGIADKIWQAVVASGERRASGRAGDSTSAADASLAATDADRLRLLRTTFTAEAEILARWGMTPGLPADALVAVAAWWRSRLTHVPDDMGRTIDALDRDLAAVTRERALRASEPGP